MGRRRTDTHRRKEEILRRAFKSSSFVMSRLLVLSLLALTLAAGLPQTADATDWLSGRESELVAVRINDGCIRISEILEKDFFPWASVHHIYAHGHTGRDDEHSFEAYDADIEAGSHYVEPDLVISRDGTLYVSHDLSAARMTGVRRDYSSMSDSEINRLRSRSGSRILKLSEVFERYGDSVYYLPELKTADDDAIEAFRTLVEEYGLEDRIMLQSEFPSALEKAEAIWPDMPKIQIVKSQSVFNESVGNDCVDEAAVRIDLMDEANCAAAHEAGKRISAWPVDTENDIRRAIDIGADAYFTGNVETAVDLELNYRRNPFGPLDTIMFASDYQSEKDFPEPKDTLAGLIGSAKKDGRHIDAAVICGDYSNVAGKHDYQISPDEAIAEIREIVSEEAPLTDDDRMIFVQGNHDRLTGAVSESGLHEFDNYLVYVLNTENDFPWKQGKTAGSRDKVKAAAARMKMCFDELIRKGETRPVFIAGHVPLHYTARASSRHSTGDNIYSSLIFDAVNEASKDLEIIYMFGHDHSKGWDCYLGGACVYKAEGDSMLLPVPHEGEVTTDEYEEKELGFTYLNAGYTGYYMNCAPEDYSSDPDSQYRAADETLTCTICEVYRNRIEITRYDAEGMHVLGAAGTADPYEDGIDKDLIPAGQYSQITDSPVLLRKHDKSREGLRDAA